MKIIKAPDQRLNTKCKPVDDGKNGVPESVIREMIGIMDDNRGLGLAAPQVGILERFFIMRKQHGREGITVVNPRILSAVVEAGRATDHEGCLSIPGLVIPVERWYSIWVSYDGLPTGKTFLYGMDARVFQHELDHLDGILITDRLAERYRTEQRVHRIRE